MEDPKIMITTSRDPSSKLKQFAKVNLDFYKLEKRMFFLTFPDRCFMNTKPRNRYGYKPVLRTDPGSGAFLTPGLGSGIGFSRIPDPKPIFLRAW